MEITPETTETPTKQVLKLNREQKRILERVEREAKDTCQKLCERFLAYFMTSEDPESEATQKYMAILNGQWLTYCKQKKLNEGSRTILSNYMQSVITEYKATQNDKLQDQ